MESALRETAISKAGRRGSRGPTAGTAPIAAATKTGRDKADTEEPVIRMDRVARAGHMISSEIRATHVLSTQSRGDRAWRREVPLIR